MNSKLLYFISLFSVFFCHSQYTEIINSRSKIIQDEIDKLQNGEAALFLISSGSHKFPEDIEIFNV